MLKQESLNFIRKVGAEYNPKQILLFGSCLEQDEDIARDIDLAVEGLSQKAYYDFWQRLLWADELGGKSVDVVRVEENVPILPMILGEGVKIYAGQIS